MATVAALSLAVTVFFAQRALDHAADVVIRGDGDTLLSGVVVDLWETPGSLDSAALGAVLRAHAPERLRYVALLDRQDHHVIAEAGEGTVARRVYLPGVVVREGRRVRLVALIPPRSETRAASTLSASRGPEMLAPYPRPHLVIEFEPPLIERLKTDLAVIAMVAAIAALVLVAIAIAWWRTTARLATVEHQAERERRLVALGRASSVIAHELRNPLAALKGHAQLLAEDLAEPSRAKAERVVASAERLERLTSVLLDFVRDGPLDVGSWTPAALVERALAGLPTDRVRVDVHGAPPAVRVDAERLSLALHNLLENAVQASEGASAPVEIRVARDDADGLVIEVRDHGPGLAPGSEAQIFDPFVTTKTRGTGLGLSIARRIAEQHHGKLRGETHPDGGAVFRLGIPLHPEPPPLR
jgi:two-component system sensor histidine kinase HydH